MNSLDPWRVIVTDPNGSVVFPRSRYGHPFYKEVPSWIHYGDDGTQRHLFDGVFVGAVPGATMPTTATAQPSVEPRNGLLATGGITVKKEFDDKQALHVEICVDGKCYRTSMDLAPAIAMLMQKLARWHQGMHASQTPPTTVIQAVENAVGAAGDAMADVMVGHHVAVMASGWLSDIGGAIGGTLRKLQPVIATVATGVATAYGGPAAGAAAGKLVPMWTDLQADLLDPKGDPKTKVAARQKIEQINQQAQSDPALAQVLAAVHQAVKNTAVAYYVKDTAVKAIKGDTKAQRDLTTVVQAAEKGDPAAKSTWEVLAASLGDQLMKSETGAKLWEKVTGRGPGTVSGWYDVVGQWHDIVGAGPAYAGPAYAVGGFWDDVKGAVLTVTGTKATNQFIKDHHLEPYVKLASQAVATYYGGPAAGAAAGAISPMVMSLGVEDKKKAATAREDIQGVKATARRHGPWLAQAADVAHSAVEHTATAYQVAQIVKDAKAGKLEAQRSLANLQVAVARGDQGAAKALQVAAMIDREQQKAPGAPIVGWSEIAGVVVGSEMGAAPYYGSFVSGPTPYYGLITA